MKRILVATTVSAGLVVGAPAAAMAAPAGAVTATAPGQAAPQGGHHDQRVSHQDKEWFSTAAAGDLFEIQGGKLALRRAVHGETRAYARRLIADHTKAYAQKAAIARMLHLKLATQPTEEMKSELADLTHHHGKDFDVAYLKTEIDDHTKDVSDTKKEIGEGHNRVVVGQARRELPVLKTHLESGKRTLKHIGGDC